MTMTTGKVSGIYISPRHGEPTVRVDQAHVIPGMGIEGDRYFRLPGQNTAEDKPGQEITFIEMEVIESLRRDSGIQISPDQTRRNIVTQGISLNDLVGSLFTVGEVQLRGLRLCEPCDYLANLTDLRILQSMAHRGGLRAEILSEGFIRINDIITAP